MACCSGCDVGIGCAEPVRIGDVLPRVVWPTDVDREKGRLHPLFLATDLAVQNCAKLSDAERAGWRNFYGEWQGFHGRETPLLGAANEWDLSQQYAKDLASWQVTLAQKCVLAGPMVRPTDDPEKSIDLSALKWVAGAAIAVAAVYALKTVL